MVRVNDDGNRVQIMHNGVIVSADGYYGEVNTRIVERLKGHHQPQEEKVFYEVLKTLAPGSTMIELGCYWAYYSLWFHKAVKGARNFMIEPNKRALQCGINNFRLNRMSGDFTQAVVGKSSIEGWQRAGAGAENAAAGHDCVKDFVQGKGIEEVALLHCDIQGYEYEMLCGCGDLVDEKKIGFFFISTRSLKAHFQCLKHLVARGYVILAGHVPKAGYSEDGLLVASSVRSCQEPIEISKKPVSLRQRFKAAFFRHALSVWNGLADVSRGVCGGRDVRASRIAALPR